MKKTVHVIASTDGIGKLMLCGISSKQVKARREVWTLANDLLTNPIEYDERLCKECEANEDYILYVLGAM